MLCRLRSSQQIFFVFSTLHDPHLRCVEASGELERLGMRSRARPALPDARESEQATVIIAVDREPMSLRRLAGIGLAIAA